ncbi:gluconate 2-dehydrogenase subunit 3 family protein [Mucilaginibacter arboris]|uniref:Gluconate 2-dehydrogenase subunit 3 family protein n=1 Tax=Mucilaginibacter arboris TaxID=2682090 RepID=A0A7K1SYG0_9SPHI|nr:gluconate 2-dehydrogenase subunit 3 family protein [Mucilaginibacter arboris]MVN22355.1 gluconate 2-dehydrogenase subunit 3 family protein [Mucilaginibacter arboris]
MDRREAVTKIAWLLGGTIVGAELFVQGGCKSTHEKVSELFSKEQISFLDEVGNTIFPATNTPGAKAAGIGKFMAVMVKDCYLPKDQKVFTKGLSQLDEASQKKNGKKFLESDPKQRTALLVDLDNEQKAYQKTKKKEDPNHYFRMMKELTMLGYFTSEVGATKALHYLPVPGKYDGDVPYKKGEKAWALS